MSKSLLLLPGVIVTLALATPALAIDGLVGAWSFDETSGSTSFDSSGSGVHGTIVGASPTQQGVIDGALAFTEPSYVDLTQFTTQQPSAPQHLANLAVGSISVWFRVDSIDPSSSMRPILYLGNNDISPNDEAIVIEVGHGAAAGSVLYFTYYLHGSTPLCFDSVVDLTIGEWHHFVVTVGQNFNTAYLDGVEMIDRDYNAGTANDRAFFSDVPNPNVLWFGKGYAKELAELRYHEGLIDDLQIYDRPLTAVEVETLWLAGQSPAPLFTRGDTNRDGNFDIADPIRTLAALFGTGPQLECESAGDSNDDGALDLADAIHSLGGIFGSGPMPSAPFPTCGAEPTADTLSCVLPACS